MGLPVVYIDLAQVPSDTPPPDIGDGGQVGPPTKPFGKGKRVTLIPEQLAPGTQESLVVPFTRIIRFGAGGQDVKGAKRAIWRGNDLKLEPFTPVYGAIARHQCQVFQEAHNLKTDGQVGPATLHALAPFFDRYAFFLYEGYQPGLSPVQAKRQMAFAYLLWGFNNRASIYYLQFRPMNLLNDLYHLPVSEDCSTFYTKMAKRARWLDPNGFNFNGAGNTTSLIAHGRKVDVARAQLGDGVFYSNPAHIGGYVGGGRIISLGSSAGPSLTPVDYRSDFYEARSYL